MGSGFPWSIWLKRIVLGSPPNWWRIWYIAFGACLLSLLSYLIVMESMFRLQIVEQRDHTDASHSQFVQLHGNDLSYSLRMNTFRRNDMLQRSLEHYSQCVDIKEIVIVWSDLER